MPLLSCRRYIASESGDLFACSPHQLFLHLATMAWLYLTFDASSDAANTSLSRIPQMRALLLSKKALFNGPLLRLVRLECTNDNRVQNASNGGHKTQTLFVTCPCFDVWKHQPAAIHIFRELDRAKQELSSAHTQKKKRVDRQRPRDGMGCKKAAKRRSMFVPHVCRNVDGGCFFFFKKKKNESLNCLCQCYTFPRSNTTV